MNDKPLMFPAQLFVLGEVLVQPQGAQTFAPYRLACTDCGAWQGLTLTVRTPDAVELDVSCGCGNAWQTGEINPAQILHHLRTNADRLH
ncbi:hypothetical protein Lfu02_21380 [Longispora fulva]|uniref:Uncharacterized protein n=1 Tax=Longispora fulva TaxID=619741 RepID=A0A8J7KLW4_9ACTN|nr:hypothetical protein [Longispora fulva]MBG6139849.1 hypothetical protein [Longispora fulva]GIG57766.1 hypothetical protein Lfu02_21380 [Longispora fulva]